MSGFSTMETVTYLPTNTLVRPLSSQAMRYGTHIKYHGKVKYPWFTTDSISIIEMLKSQVVFYSPSIFSIAKFSLAWDTCSWCWTEQWGKADQDAPRLDQSLQSAFKKYTTLNYCNAINILGMVFALKMHFINNTAQMC